MTFFTVPYILDRLRQGMGQELGTRTVVLQQVVGHAGS
jgi:hypothetical protein